jgi:hypothetical protein
VITTIIDRPSLSLNLYPNMASNATRTKVGKHPSVPSTLVGMTAVSYFKKLPSTKQRQRHSTSAYENSAAHHNLE